MKKVVCQPTPLWQTSPVYSNFEPVPSGDKGQVWSLLPNSHKIQQYLWQNGENICHLAGNICGETFSERGIFNRFVFSSKYSVSIYKSRGTILQVYNRILQDIELFPGHRTTWEMAPLPDSIPLSLFFTNNSPRKDKQKAEKINSPRKAWKR